MEPLVPAALQQPRADAAFTCHHCGNHCRITRKSAADQVQFQGAECGRWQDERVAPEAPRPGEDIWTRRERLLLHHAGVTSAAVGPGAALGIPRASLAPELLPLWTALARAMGREAVLSSPATWRTLAQGREAMPDPACPPLQLAAAQVLELLDQGVDHVLLPRVEEEGLAPLEALPGLTLYRPEVRLDGGPASAMVSRRAAALLGLSASQLAAAVQSGIVASHRCRRDLQAASRDTLAGDHPKIAVLIGWSAGLPPLLDGGLVAALRRHGLPSLPQEALPLDRVDADLDDGDTCSGPCHDQVRAAALCARDDRLVPVLVHSTGCPADASTGTHLGQLLADRPFLALDVDEARDPAALSRRVEYFAATLP